MKKFLSVFILFFALFFFSRPVYASPFEIHAIYLKGGLGGDAVLLKSNGEYLLMDTGKAKTKKVLVSYLKRRKVKKLSVYISHVDEDHIGALNAVAKNFRITKLYMPKRNIASDAKLNDTGGKLISASRIYARIRKIAKKEKAKLVELHRGSAFKFGKASCKVIGPIETVTDAEYEKIKDLRSDDDAYGKNIARFMKSLGPSYYLNGMSLSTMITCNHARYLTMGDTVGAMENYIARLSDVKADILKMSHHALGNASYSEFLKACMPSCVFGSSCHSTASTLKARNRVLTYTKVQPLVTGHLKKNIVYSVNDEGLITVRLTKK